MPIKKIVLIEPNKETAEKLLQWCREEGYKVELFSELDPSVILPKKPDVLLVDIHAVDVLDIMGDKGDINAELLDSLTRVLSNDPNFSKVYIVLIAPKTAVHAIAKGIEADADNFITEFSDKRAFLEDLRQIASKLQPGREKIKLLNLNLINFLLGLFSSSSREDFFLLAPIVFNASVIRRITPYVGETTVTAIIARLNATVGFMGKTRFQDGKIFMDGVDEASKGAGVPLLCSAFRDYVYGFVHLVRTLTSDILIERWDWERK